MPLPSPFTLEYSIDDYSLPLNDSLEGTKIRKLQKTINFDLKLRNRHNKLSRSQFFSSTKGKLQNDLTVEHVDACDELADSIHLAKQRLSRVGDSHENVNLFSGTEKHCIQNSISKDGLQESSSEKNQWQLKAGLTA
jgi:hypothetical protein